MGEGRKTRPRPTPQQFTIGEAVLTGQRAIMAEAVAGAGKSSTLDWIASLVHRPAMVFLAFNRGVVERLRLHLSEDWQALTIHQLGMITVQRTVHCTVRIREDKYTLIVRASLLRHGDDLRWAARMVEFIHYTRVTLTPLDSDELLVILERYRLQDLTMWNELLPRAREILEEGARQALLGVVDFDDCLWLVWWWHLTPPQFDMVLVDEAQDLSRAQAHVALASLATGGQIVLVGDPHQSIYGFTGADPDAFWQIQDILQAPVYPLSVTFRCPLEHVALAQQIVPAIRAAPRAAQGSVIHAHEQDTSLLMPGMTLAGRTSLALLRQGMILARAGIPVRWEGTDVPARVLQRYGEVQDWGRSQRYRVGYDQLSELITRWNGQHASSTARYRELELAWLTLGADSESMFRQALEAQRPSQQVNRPEAIRLVTLHHAKGAEYDAMWIVAPHEIPLSTRYPWEAEQEEHLLYIGVTRSRRVLGFLHTDIRDAQRRTLPASIASTGVERRG